MNRRLLLMLVGVSVAIVAAALLVIPDSTPSSVDASPEGRATLVGGGLTDDSDASGVTSPPEEQPAFEITKLAPGEKPPQFVVVSFDGGVESKTGLMEHYLELARQVEGRFSFFISGVYLLPDNKMRLNYDPPGHPRGTSAIGFADPDIIGTRIDRLSEAWRDGNEIGTHFMGHFCGSGGVGSWDTADWTSEIDQGNRVIDNWRVFNPQAAETDPLPFDSSVVKGGRTPCLEGDRAAMYKAFKKAGYEYDTSNSGELAWPEKNKYGLWDIPLQTIKISGFRTLSMDYNFLVNQNDGQQDASPERCAEIKADTLEAYKKALRDVHDGNRAPLILGNHMNEWVCGAYRDALSEFIADAHDKYEDVKFISTLDLAHWLDAQDPAVLATLQKSGTQQQ